MRNSRSTMRIQGPGNERLGRKEFRPGTHRTAPPPRRSGPAHRVHVPPAPADRPSSPGSRRSSATRRANSRKYARSSGIFSYLDSLPAVSNASHGQPRARTARSRPTLLDRRSQPVHGHSQHPEQGARPSPANFSAGGQAMPEMTSRQRLLTAMRREQPDRVPIHVRGVPAWNEWVRTRHPSYAPVIEAVAKAWRSRRHLVAPARSFFPLRGPSGDRNDAHSPRATGISRRITLGTPQGPLTHERHISRSGDAPGLPRASDRNARRRGTLPLASYEPVKVDATPSSS